MPRLAWLATLLALLVCRPSLSQVITGAQTKWETLTLDFTGPQASELDGRAQVGGATGTPNPFLDFRLQVAFTSPSGVVYDVPGFFDGDGAGGGTGSVWRTRFTPDEVGEWSYTASFREGANVAIDLSPTAGAAGTLIDGLGGVFSVSPAAASATGHFATGRLEYVGGHYLKRRDGGYWIKSGADSPENFLGYRGFDNTQTKGTGGNQGRLGILHDYGGHAGDWNPGDPAWDSPDFDLGNTLADGGDARNIIGYLNYLSSIGVNSQYFLANNIGGDGEDSHPFAAVGTAQQLSGEEFTGTPNDNLHYDVSKLAQWEAVFRHAQEQDIHLHFVLNEAENHNKLELDDGQLGVERKLFYRELVARFGHHNSLQWNLSEEYDLNNGFGGSQAAEAARVNEFADYLAAIDPYAHPTTVHNADKNDLLTPAGVRNQSAFQYFIGADNGAENFDIASVQRAGEAEDWSSVVESFRTATADAGRPWAVFIDEPQSITRIGVGANDDTQPGTTNAERFNTVRKTMTWDILLSGGAGVEWFIHDADQDVEDQRVYEQVYRETAIARRFLEENTPFWRMAPNDGLLSGEDGDYGGGEVFAIEGEVYALYLPDGSNDDNNASPGGSSAPTLDLTAFAGEQFTLRWFNPRTGEFAPGAVALAGGADASLGPTPGGFSNTDDWAALVIRVTGDMNDDGVVNAADYTVWRDSLGDSVSPGARGDANGDGLVTAADYLVFREQFGQQPSPQAAAAAPQPATASLLLLAALLLAGRVR
ncbi:MAG: DUF5060 domain-containing protein [Planctomycetota bacterium]